MRAGRARVIREARKRAGARVGRPVRASAGRDIAHAAPPVSRARLPKGDLWPRVRWLSTPDLYIAIHRQTDRQTQYNLYNTPLAGLKRTSTKSVMRCATTLMLTTRDGHLSPAMLSP